MELVKKINKNPFEELQKLTNEQLEEVIKLANDKYRNTDKPIMEDSIYDMLMDWLEHTNPKSKLLKEIGAKVKLKNNILNINNNLELQCYDIYNSNNKIENIFINKKFINNSVGYITKNIKKDNEITYYWIHIVNNI